MEVLKLRSVSGIAKIVGIIACIAGAITLALYKGPHFNLLCIHHLFESHNSHGIVSHVPSSQTRIKGCFLLFVSNILWGLWLVLQVALSNLATSMCLWFYNWINYILTLVNSNTKTTFWISVYQCFRIL